MRLFGAMLLIFVAGCASVLPEKPSPVDEAVAEALGAARAPAAEQKAVLARAQQRFLQEPTPANRLKLAVLLTALPAPMRDDGRAAELLDPIADAGAPGIGRFAALLVSQIAERQRIQRDMERFAKERAATDKERAERERERAERAERERERDKREEALRQQLEALRSIERGILEREDRMRRRQR
jgi:hypothetical protein